MTDPRYPVQPQPGYYQQQPYPQGYYPPPQFPRTAQVPVETNHVLHLILTLLTCGLWAPVWIVMTLINMGSTRTVTYY